MSFRDDDDNYFESGPNGTPGNHQVAVFVDGDYLPGCVKAHRGQGWASVYRTGRDGRVEHDGLGRPKVDVLRGVVTFKIEPEGY